MKQALSALLTSKKVWMLILGMIATATTAFLTKYGLALSDATVQKIAEYMSLGFGPLLASQGAADVGKSAAIIRANFPEPTQPAATNIGTNIGNVSTTPPAADAAVGTVVPAQPPSTSAVSTVLLALTLGGIVLGGCGPSSRQTAIRASYAGAVAARTQFEQWDAEHTMAIAKAATSVEDGTAKLDAYIKAREPVSLAFKIAFDAIDIAIKLDDDQSMATSIVALASLYSTLNTLTGKVWKTK